MSVTHEIHCLHSIEKRETRPNGLRYTVTCNHCDAAFRATRKAHSRIRVCARARVYKQTCGNASYVVISYNVALFQQISIVATCGSFVFTTYTEKYIGKYRAATFAPAWLSLFGKILHFDLLPPSGIPRGGGNLNCPYHI